MPKVAGIIRLYPATSVPVELMFFQPD